MALRRLKAGRKLLMINSTSDSPVSIVNFVKKIEVVGADRGDVIAVHVYDETRNEQPDPYVFKGSGLFNVLVPRGKLLIKRLRGSNPITVYAHS